MDFPDVKGKDPKFLTNEDYVGLFAREQKKFPLYFRTGSDWRYTNTNFMLLALIAGRCRPKARSDFVGLNFLQNGGHTRRGLEGEGRVGCGERVDAA